MHESKGNKMKKIVITLTLIMSLFMVLIVPAFANDDGVSIDENQTEFEDITSTENIEPRIDRASFDCYAYGDRLSFASGYYTKGSGPNQYTVYFDWSDQDYQIVLITNLHNRYGSFRGTGRLFEGDHATFSTSGASTGEDLGLFVEREYLYDGPARVTGSWTLP